MKKYLLLIVFLGILTLSGVGVVYAQNGNIGYTPLEPIPGVNTGDAVANFPAIIKTVFQILFSLGALLTVAMLVVGGIEYMVSDVVPLKAEGMRRAQAALWGMAILAGSWLLLNTINPELLNFKLPTTGSGGTGGTSPTSGSGGGGSGNTMVGDRIGIDSKDPNGARLLNEFTAKCKGTVTPIASIKYISTGNIFTEYYCIVKK
jgi:hypothetical protein